MAAQTRTNVLIAATGAAALGTVLVGALAVRWSSRPARTGAIPGAPREMELALGAGSALCVTRF